MLLTVGLSVLLWFGQFAVAYVALELVFRYMDVTPSRLGSQLGGYGRLYAAGAALFALAGGFVQVWLVGWAGLILVALNWVPWWVLWRFGLRKQLTFLFKDDGGRHNDTEEPDL